MTGDDAIRRRRNFNLVNDAPARPAPGVTRRDLLDGNASRPGTKVVHNIVGGVRMTPGTSDAQSGGQLGGRQLGGPLSGVNGTGVNGSATVVNNSRATTIINNNSTVNYVTNVSASNSSWAPNSWYPPVYGYNSCWNSWGSSSGFSFGLGFGSGAFSFGLYYSSYNTPLCASYCNPWWNGYCGYVSVYRPPSWGWSRPCWSPTGVWYSNYFVYSGVPAAWCTPVYAYTPVVALPSVAYVDSYYTTPAVVYVDTPVAAPTSTPSPAATAAFTTGESQAWELLSTGFPRSAADLFAQSHDENLANPRPLVGYAMALATLEDLAAAATVMRQALAIDPGALASFPVPAELGERLRLLEQTSEIASRQASTATDALFLLASWRAIQNKYTEAHFAILSAQGAGEQSLAAARLRSWLEARMTPNV